MSEAKKVLIFGAAGRVGLGLVEALLQRGIDVCAVDFIPQNRLQERIARAVIDAGLSAGSGVVPPRVYGDFDVLNSDRVAELLSRERPDIVVNYAIPFTWDAAKTLPNYGEISRAGLGAFAAVQVLAPRAIARALAASGLDAKYIVGNLPDITVPILYGLSNSEPLVLPAGGAGNVGLIEAAIRHSIAAECELHVQDVNVFLVAHHVHWVAPREPGYRNDAPFLLRAFYRDKDITDELGDPRELMNRAIVGCYEAGAAFSSTTALLAARLVSNLLDEEGHRHTQHIPAPNGLPGGYPVRITGGKIELDLPVPWREAEAVELMRQAHQRDGIERIADDGTIHFDPQSVAILSREAGIELPEVLTPGDLDTVAREQIRVARAAIDNARP